MTVYLLLGDDEERKSRGVDKLRAGRAVDAYNASEISPETLVSACNSLSLFGEGPFVVLKDLDSWNAAQKAVIVDYLKNPSPGSDLLLHGKMRLLQETEKLSLYVSDGTATHEDLAALCPPDVQSNIFAFVDSLAAGERDRALALLEDLIGTGEPPLRLTFMIRRQFQLIARARALFERGIPRKEIASRLKVPPFVARKLEEQGGRLDEENLERALGLVQDLESGLKGGSYLSDELQVEMTVLGLSKNSA